MATYTTRLIVPCSLASLRTKPRSKSGRSNSAPFLVLRSPNTGTNPVFWLITRPDISATERGTWLSTTVYYRTFQFLQDPLPILEKIEAVVETVDEVAEVIEKVAERVEKVADEIGNELPEDGKLRRAFDSIENAAKETANAANLVDEILDKVDEVEKVVAEVMEPMDRQN